MQNVERERREDEEEDFTVVDQHGKVYNENAGIRDYKLRKDSRCPQRQASQTINWWIRGCGTARRSIRYSGPQDLRMVL